MNLYNFIYLKLYKKLPLSVRVFARDVYFILKYGTRDMFVTVGIDLNTKCNLKCYYCPNYYLGGKGDNYMSTWLLRKIVNELVGINYLGNISVPALYSEPLLDEGLVMKLSYIHGKLPRCKIIVFTNATRLTVSKYLELVEAGVSELIVTGHNDLGRKNIALLKEFTTSKFIEYVSLDVKNLTNRAGNVPLINVKLLESCIDPSRYLYVTYSGKVLFCCNDYLECNVMGDLSNDSLMTVWRGDEYRKLRVDVKQGVFNLGMCKRCGYGELDKELRVKVSEELNLNKKNIKGLCGECLDKFKGLIELHALFNPFLLNDLKKIEIDIDKSVKECSICGKKATVALWVIKLKKEKELKP